MNCDEFTNALDDYLDENLPPGQTAIVEAHAGDCAACRQRLARERTLREQLRRLPAPTPDDAWFDQAIARAVEQDHHRRRWRWMGVGGVLAASLVLAISLTVQPPPASMDSPVPPGLSIAINEEREINLMVESANSLDSATFTVLLPEGIEITGFPGHNKVSWEGRLESGKNLLVLPLRAAAGSGGDVVTHVTYTGKSKTFILRMDVKAADPVTRM